MVKTVHVDHPSKVMDFNELAKNVPVMVMFYMPGCYHCDMMKPEWKKFEKKMEERYSEDSAEESPGLAMVNSNHMSGTTGSERVSGFPTVLLLENGKVKSEYEGDRTADDLVRFTESNASKLFTTSSQSSPTSLSSTPVQSSTSNMIPEILPNSSSKLSSSLQSRTRKRRRSSKTGSRRNKTTKRRRTSSRTRKNKSKTRSISKTKSKSKQQSRKSNSRKSKPRKTRRRTRQSKQSRRTKQAPSTEFRDFTLSPSQTTTTRGLDQLFGEI